MLSIFGSPCPWASDGMQPWLEPCASTVFQPRPLPFSKLSNLGAWFETVPGAMPKSRQTWKRHAEIRCRDACDKTRRPKFLLCCDRTPRLYPGLAKRIRSEGHMIVGVPKEVVAGERRVALVPDLVAKLQKAGLEVVLQPGAGEQAGFLDASYAEKGARLGGDALSQADVLLKVQPPTAEEISQVKEGSTLIGFLQPYSNQAGIQALAARRVP